MKKILKLVIVVLLLVAAIPVGTKLYNTVTSGEVTLPLSDNTATQKTDGKFTYEIINNEVYITGLDTDKMARLVIPSEIEGRPVTRIKDYAFDGCFPGQNVDIPTGIKKIGENALRGCGTITIHTSSELNTRNAPWGAQEVVATY